MTPWTDAVQALNPELWLQFKPIEPKSFVNSGYVPYTFNPNFPSSISWIDGPFGTPGGVSIRATDYISCSSSIPVASDTVLAFFRWDGYNVIWNSKVLAFVNGINGTGWTFWGRYIALTVSDSGATDVHMAKVLDGSWHLVAVSSDVVSVKMYLDGSLIKEFPPLTGTLNYKDIAFSYYSGSYAEALGFHRVLSETEISNLWSSAVTTGLVQPPSYDMSGQRMALDVDGSVITVKVRSGEELEIAAPQKRYLMDESPNLITLMPSVKWKPRITIMFPEPRDIFGFFLAGSFGTNTGVTNDVAWLSIGYGTTVQVSRSTGDVSLADWDTVPITWGRGFLLGNPYYGVGTEYIDEVLLPDSAAGTLRTNFGFTVDNRLVARNDLYGDSSLGVVQQYADRVAKVDQAYCFDTPVRNVSFLRFNLSQVGFQNLGYHTPTSNSNTCVSLQSVYLYGQKSNSDVSVDHSLDIWQEERFAALELKTSSQGDVALRSSQDFRFCVTNRSSRSTARDIAVFADALIENAAAPFSSQFMFHSAADLTGRFDRQVSIGSLAPGEQSEVIVVRRVTPSFSTEGTYIPRILARVGRWD